MKLHQALKLKNRLVGEINRLKVIFNRENSRRSDDPSKVDPKEIFDKIKHNQSLLITLKANIAAANISIYPLIEEMSELKTEIQYLQSLSTREGIEVERSYGTTSGATYTWNAFLNQAKVDSLVEDLQKRINDLQDKIDAYNASTDI